MLVNGFERRSIQRVATPGRPAVPEIIDQTRLPHELRLGILETVPNLRKISMSPWVDVDAAAERMGDGYVFSRKQIFNHPRILGANTQIRVN